MKNIEINKKLIALITILAGLLVTIDLFAQDTGGNAVYDATIRANVDGVKQALDTGADINAQSDNRYSPLMWACTYSSRANYAEVAKYLILAGADVNITANDGTTALLEAAESSAEITQLLLNKGADIKARRDDGRGLFTSCIFGILMDRVDYELAEFVLSKGADVNEAATSGDIEGWAPIHYAVSNGNEELIRFLVKNGADVNATTKDGKTPLSIASEAGNEEIIAILKSHKAK